MSETIDLAAKMSPMRGRDPRSESFATRFTKSEIALLSGAAKAEGKNVREWARDILMREAGRGVPDRAVFTELIALRQQVAAVFAQVAVGKTMTLDAYEKLNADLRRSKHRTAREVLEQYTITGEE